MSPSSRAYKLLCALYRKTLGRMRWLEWRRTWSGLGKAAASVVRKVAAAVTPPRPVGLVQLENLEPRLLLSAGMTGQLYNSTNLSGSPAVTKDLVIAAGPDRKVYAVELKTGKQKWVFEEIAENNMPLSDSVSAWSEPSKSIGSVRAQSELILIETFVRGMGPR